jgi:hypothetical protein
MFIYNGKPWAKRQGLHKQANDIVLFYSYFKQEVDARQPLYGIARMQHCTAEAHDNTGVRTVE